MMRRYPTFFPSHFQATLSSGKGEIENMSPEKVIFASYRDREMKWGFIMVFHFKNNV
jgi:hypothetical protein